MSYSVSGGKIDSPIKTVIYGPEGIGKSTFAAQFPGALFIDTEGSTDRMDVQRITPRPSSWQMLMDMCNEVRVGHIPCATLVIDTADWAERMAITALCSRAHVDGLEGFGYGKGYVYIKEEFGKLLDLLEEIKNAGHNIVLTAHAQITKFEQPDEMGSYDRWAMKTTKQVAPLICEWCDMLLFLNYKTVVIKDGDGKMAKNKAQGGRTRVMYTTHHACWDAKNRFNLPDECTFEYSVIAPHIWTPQGHPASEAISIAPQPTPAHQPVPQAPAPSPAPQKQPDPLDTFEQVARQMDIPVTHTAQLRDTLRAQGIPDALADLMAAKGVTESELRHTVAYRGYFPADMPVKDYPQDFVDACLIGAFDQVYKTICEMRSNDDLPF